MKPLWWKLWRLVCSERQKRQFKSRINHVSLTPQGEVHKQAGPTFSRGGHRYDPRQLLQREAAFLKRLDGRHAPRLLVSGENWIEMEHCGEELSVENLPNDWHSQVAEIVAVLDQAGIVHRDIKHGNLLVKNGHLYLIDFGWAIWTNETPYMSPRELCEDVPPEYIYDNRAALEWLLSSYIK